jgi:hypothetical protein
MEKEMKKFRDFESARDFVRSLGLKSREEWQTYYQSGKKPDDIPANPNRDYKKEFKTMGDWLGTGTVSTRDRTYLPFTEARDFARSLGLKNREEWNEYCKSGDKPDDIPKVPAQSYKKEWEGVGDWLGTGRVANQDKVYRSFAEARKFAMSLGLKTGEEWKEYCKSGDKPDNIPQKPERTYKNEWKGTGDWLGTGRIANQDREYRPFKEAREFVRALNLKNQKAWYDYCKSGNKPDDIPSDPWITYKEWEKK